MNPQKLYRDIQRHGVDHVPVLQLWIPLLLGLIVCIAFTGIRIFDPNNLSWQLQSGDGAQHLIGWRFFLQSPLLQFPLGANPAFGEAVSNSIVYSDSIPLLAIPLKYFAPLLPQSFQYFGLWIVLCFVLQSIFAWKLVALFIDDTAGRACASALFVLSPSMLNRMGGHEALVAHWIILAAIYLLLQTPQKSGRWRILLGCAALVHAYLLAMALVLYLVDILTEHKRYPKSGGAGIVWRDVIRRVGITLSILALIGWVAGYFTVRSVGSGGFSETRTNLLAPFDPNDRWSRFMPDLDSVTSFEGFNYFGFGLLTLAVIVGFQYLVMRKRAPLDRALVSPLIFASFGFAFYALSHQIAAGSYEVFSYPFPGILRAIFGPFRSTGRFLWVTLYLLELALLYLFVAAIGRKRRTWGLCAILVLQIIDLSVAMPTYRNMFNSAASANRLSSMFWTEVPSHYKRIAIVGAKDGEFLEYAPIAMLAANNGMSINAAYLARIDQKKVKNTSNAMTRAAFSGEFSTDTLYVFTNDALWGVALSSVTSSDLTTTVDGFRVLAPGWSGCVSKCNVQRLSATDKEKATQRFKYTLGTPIDFTVSGNAEPYLFGEWSHSEAELRWTNGNEAYLMIKLSELATKPIVLRLEGKGFTPPAHPLQTVELSVNGKLVSTLKYEHSDGDAMSIKNILIPTELVEERQKLLKIHFSIKNPTSERENRLGKDRRKRGLALKSITLNTVAD